MKRKVRHKKVLSSDEESYELSSGNELVNLPKDRAKKNYLTPPRMCVVNSHQPIAIDDGVNSPKEQIGDVSAISNTSRTDMKNQAVGMFHALY